MTACGHSAADQTGWHRNAAKRKKKKSSNM